MATRDKSWGYLRRCFSPSPSVGSQGQGPSLPGSVLGPLLASAGGWNSPTPRAGPWEVQRFRPPVRVCCNSGGEVSAHPPSLRSPEPLYTKQPPQSGLNFREAVSVEAAARDFSMCFQVKSRPFQLCQETAPPFPLWLPPGVRAAWGGGGAGLQGHILPQTPPPGLPAQTPSVPPLQAWHPLPIHTPQLKLRREPWNWRWGVGRGTEKNLIPWRAVMAPSASLEHHWAGVETCISKSTSH